jgi:hypothetical protein
LLITIVAPGTDVKQSNANSDDVTTMMGEHPAFCKRPNANPSKLVSPTFTSALGWPSREDAPAAKIIAGIPLAMMLAQRGYSLINRLIVMRIE